MTVTIVDHPEPCRLLSASNDFLKNVSVSLRSDDSATPKITRLTDSSSDLPPQHHRSSCCTLCKRNYSSPKVLDCLHTFCKACLESKIERKSLPGGAVAEGCHSATELAVTCAICSQRQRLDAVKGVDGLVDDFGQGIANWETNDEGSEPLSNKCGSCDKPGLWSLKCDKCGIVCDACNVGHQSMRSLHNHQIHRHDGSPPSVPLQMPMCKTHASNKVTHFCKTCRTFMCQECPPTHSTDSKDGPHVIETIADNGKDYAESLTTLLPILTEKKTELQRIVAVIDDIKTNNNLVLSKSQENIEIIRTVLRTFVDQLVDALNAEALRRHKTVTEKQLQNHMNEMRFEVLRVERSMSDTVDLAERILKDVDDHVPYRNVFEPRVQKLANYDTTGHSMDSMLSPVKEVAPISYAVAKEILPTILQAVDVDPAELMMYHGNFFHDPTTHEGNNNNNDTESCGCTPKMPMSMTALESRLSEIKAFVPRQSSQPTAQTQQQTSESTAAYWSGSPKQDGSQPATPQHARAAPSSVTQVTPSAPTTNTTVAPATVVTAVDYSTPTSTANSVSLSGHQHPSHPSNLSNVYYPPRSHLKRQKMIYYCKFGEFGVIEGQFTEPSGVAVTRTTDIVIADTNNHRIQVFDCEGRFKFQFGSCGKQDGQLLYPNRVAVNPLTGEFIVTERSPTHQIQVFSPRGEFVRKFGSAVLQHPRGVCVDKEGRIIVVECKVMRVIVFLMDGTIVQKFSCSRYLEFPNGICAANNEILISDNRAHCIRVFSYEGHYLRQIGGEGVTNYPIGVGVNVCGQVVVADNHNNFNLTIFDQKGNLLYALESKVKHAQCFDVALMDEGSVVLASKDYRVYLYRYVGNMNSLSGPT